MVEVDLNHIYKKYPGNDKNSVNDFDLHIKDKEFADCKIKLNTLEK